jgi:membrane fusion protein, multidrug efflux system
MIHSHELADWQRELTAADARVAFGSTALERSRRLLAEGAVSREEVERREMELRLAEADRERAREVVEHLHPESGNVVIQAPREGMVFRVLTGPGEAVVPGAPLVELGSTRVLWVVGAVPEPRCRSWSGETGEGHLPRPSRVEAEGRVISLGSRVDPALRTVELRVQMDPIPAGVRTGPWPPSTSPPAPTRKGSSSRRGGAAPGG